MEPLDSTPPPEGTNRALRHKPGTCLVCAIVPSLCLWGRGKSMLYFRGIPPNKFRPSATTARRLPVRYGAVRYGTVPYFVEKLVIVAPSR